MDEILLANFMLFHDIVRDVPLRPLARATRSWELDSLRLHENRS